MKPPSDVFSIDSDIFSRAPMSFLKPDHIGYISTLTGLIAIETSARTAWTPWQSAQLGNLLTFAMERSSFWKNRLSGAMINGRIDWSKTPILRKSDLRMQFETEGALLRPKDKGTVVRHQTSGSSGVPTQFYISQWNGEYNLYRSFATYLIEGRDLMKNRTHLKLKFDGDFQYLSTKTFDSWIGVFSPFLKTGRSKVIEHKPVSNRADDITMNRIRDELEKDDIGYLVANPWVVECLLSAFGPGFFERSRTHMWIPMGSTPSREIREVFTDIGIPVRATYSCEEVGTIGVECPQCPGHYHICVSNVIVEIDHNDRIDIDGKIVGRVLVTHLHSYASPFIKYDLGDVASLDDRCDCGHDGPTLSSLMGRGKNLVKLPDGRSRIFSVQLWNEPWLSKYKEYRFRQTAIDTILVELAMDGVVSEEEKMQFEDFIFRVVGPGMKTQIVCRPDLDWGREMKRNLFYSNLS